MAQENSTYPHRFPQGFGNIFSIALYEPEIPLNVGSIARTCACTGLPLHLVGRLGFRPDDRLARRAGLDYWEHVESHIHRTWEEFLQEFSSHRLWLFTTKGRRTHWDVKYKPGDVLVFGSERTGLPSDILGGGFGETVVIPMAPERRSLNLSNTVAIVVYEALRQQVLTNQVKNQANFQKPYYDKG